MLPGGLEALSEAVAGSFETTTTMINWSPINTFETNLRANHSSFHQAAFGHG